MLMTEHSIRKHLPGYMIAAGTQVVLQVEKPVFRADGSPAENCFRKPGSVGVIAECPARVDGQYIVEFSNGETARATFEELVLRRQEIENQLSKLDVDLRPYIIYRCQVGSKAFGLAHDQSDDDIRGIFLPPARLHWSLYSLPEQLEFTDGADEVFWEIEKFVRLALKANPNVLETLWTPIVIQADETAEQLRSIRTAFLSKHLYKTYSGYVLSQFRRMKNTLKNSGKYKPKHAMHLVRLLHCGVAALRTGEILIDVGDHREELLNIRDGNLSFEAVQARALEIDAEFQQEFAVTDLPEQPDFEVVNQFLVDARRRAANDQRD